jgi:hypothetical protein
MNASSLPLRHRRWVALLALAVACGLLGRAIFDRLWDHGSHARTGTPESFPRNVLCGSSAPEEGGEGGEITVSLGSLSLDGQETANVEVSLPRSEVCFGEASSSEGNGGENFIQFSRFLMFVSDCWPAQYAKDIFDHYAAHGSLYRINIPGAKHSAAVFSSFMTGGCSALCFQVEASLRIFVLFLCTLTLYAPPTLALFRFGPQK